MMRVARRYIPFEESVVIDKRAFAAVLVLVLLIAPSVVLAQDKAGVVTVLEGNVMRSSAAGAAPAPLKFKDDVYKQDTIRTGDQSLARMLLGGKAVVTVRERSVLTITEIPGRTTLQLEGGKFALAAARERMTPGEEIVIRTPNAVAGVRGTVVITEVTRQSAQAGGANPPVLTNFYVLRGSIVAQQFDPATQQPVGTPMQVGTLESYSTAGAAAPRVQPILPSQVAQIIAGLSPSGQRPGSDIVLQQLKPDALRTAITLASALAGQPFAIAPPLPPFAVTPTFTTQAESTRVLNPIDKSSNGSQDVCLKTLSTPSCGLAGIAGDVHTEQQLTNLLQNGSAVFGAGTVLTLSGPLKTFSGSFTSTQLTALIQAINTFIIETGIGVPFIQVAPGALVSLAGPLAALTNSTLLTQGSVLDVLGALLSTSPLPLLALDPTTVQAPFGNMVDVVGAGARLTLAGPLFSDIGGTLSTGANITNPTSNAQLKSFLVILDGGVITDTSSAPFISFTGTRLTSAGNLVTVRRSGASPSTLTLAGPLLQATGGSITTVATALNQNGSPAACCQLVSVGQGAQVTSSTTQPLISLNGTTVTAGHNLVDVFDTTSVLGEPVVVAPASMKLAGPLLSATNSTITSTMDALQVRRSSFTSTATGPLIDVTGGSLTLGTSTTSGLLLRLFASDTSGATASPASVTLGGPLARLTSTTASMTSDAVGVFNGGTLATSGAGALLQLSGSTLSARDLLLVTGLGGVGGSTPASFSSAGGVLDATSSTVTLTADVVRVDTGATLTTTSGNPLVQLQGSRLTAGTGFAADLFRVFGATARIAGPVLNATSSTLTVPFGVVDVSSAGTLVSTTTNPLITLDRSALSLTNAVTRLFTSFGAGSRVTLAGPILAATNGSSVTSPGDRLLASASGGLTDITTQTAPIVSFTGGSTLDANALLFAGPVDGAFNTNGSTGALFSFTGGAHTISKGAFSTIDMVGTNTGLEPGGVLVDDGDGGLTLDRGFVVATDRPLRHAGALVEADGATLTASRGITLDRALFEASAPLFNLKNGADLTITANNGVDLVNQAKLVSLAGPLIKLDASRLTIANGNGINLSGGSLLKVLSGDLIALSNGSVLNIANGHLLNITGNSVLQINNGTVLAINNSTVTVSRAFVNFTASGALNVSNSLVPAGSCPSCGGVPIAFTNGAVQSNVSVSGFPFQGSGTATFNGGAAVLLSGPNAKLTISGN